MELKFFEEIAKKGGRAYFVGGFVRDKILGFPNKDIDIEVFGVSNEDLEDILLAFGNFKVVGNFEIYLNKNIEIFLNKEKNTEISMRNSGKRRDLTINSLYYDPLEDKIYDFFNGIKDMEKKQLKYCSKETFLEDPLRILRVAYFYGKYEFEISDELKKLIIFNKKLIFEAAEERIFREFEKILMEIKNSKKALELLQELGVLELLIGENINYEKIENIKKDRVLMWSLLYKGGREFPYYFMDEKKLVKEIQVILDGYTDLEKLYKNYSEYTLKKIAVKTNLKTLLRLYGILEKDKRVFILNIFKTYLNFKKQLIPLINGKDLINMGFKAQKNFGIILDEIYDIQLRGDFKEKKEALEYVKNRYKEFTKFS